MATPTLNTKTSVVDYLKSKGQDSSVASRAKLAATYGIKNYTATGAQNTQLLAYLAGGGNVKQGVDTIINSDQAAVKDAAGTKEAPPERGSGTTNNADDTASSPIVTKTKMTAQDILPGEEAPKAPDYTGTLIGLRKTFNVNDLEQRLNDLTLEGDNLAAARRTDIAGIRDKTVSMNVINGKVSEADRAHNELIDANLRQQSYISNQIKNAYSVIDTMMKYQQLDYTAASDKYHDDFDAAYKAITLGRETDNDERDTARANLQVVYNNLTSGGADFNALSKTDLANINKMEVQAGLPIGFINTLKSKNPKADIITSSTRQEGNGAKYTDIVMRDPSGKISVQSVYLGKERVPSSGGGADKPTQFEITNSAFSSIDKVLDDPNAKTPSKEPVKDQNGYITPAGFKQIIKYGASTGISKSEILSQYGGQLYPGEDNTYPGYGLTGKEASSLAY